MKVVIANSIGIDKDSNYIIHSPSRWSEGVKKENWFAYYPWELAYLSSLLKSKTQGEIKFLDGCLMLLDFREYQERIMEERPDWLVMESGTRMIQENMNLALKIKEALGTKIVFTGAHATACPESLINEGVDFVCLGEYEFTVLELIQGRNPEEIPGLYSNPRRALVDVNLLPWPEDKDVSRIEYGKPGEPSSEYLEIQCYASRGCFRSCNFCVSRNLYYGKPNWRPREVHDVIHEIKYLKEKYPHMEGIFFDEEVHNGRKEFILALSRALREEGLDRLRYEAMCDIQLLDEETLDAMKSAGYYMLRVGIESGSETVNDSIGKPVSRARIISLLERIKNRGLKTYGTFMFGAPHSSQAEDLKTVEFIEKLVRDGLLDNLQVSLCTPQPGTPFYHWAKSREYIVDHNFNHFDGGACSVVSYPGYLREDIFKMKERAVRARDHFSFVKRIKDGSGLSWFRKVRRKHGVRKSLFKMLQRISYEFLYQAGWRKK